MQADEIAVHIEPIVNGSLKLYVYLEGERYETGGAFTTIMTISPMPDEPDGVMIHGAMGRLTDEINVQIGLALRARGYRTAYIEVAPGRRVSRRAENLTADGRLDMHRIDLMQEV